MVVPIIWLSVHGRIKDSGTDNVDDVLMIDIGIGERDANGKQRRRV